MEKLTMMINKNELNIILHNMRIAALAKEQYENILNMFDSEPDANVNIFSMLGWAYTSLIVYNIVYTSNRIDIILFKS